VKLGKTSYGAGEFRLVYIGLCAARQ